MRAVSECAQCLLRLATTTADAAGADEKVRMQCVNAALNVLAQDDFSRPPPDIANEILERLLVILDTDDPFYNIKRECNNKAKEVSLKLGRRALQNTSGNERLAATIRLAVCGNLIDFATTTEVDIDSQAPSLLEQPFTIMHVEEFMDELERADSVLFLADNAGEIAFDRFLLQELLGRGKKVTIAVKGGPALNDALIEDVCDVGLDRLEGPAGTVKIITTGAARMGVNLEASSKEFMHELNGTDLVLAKGQANLETLSGSGLNIFFLSLVKCNTMASLLGVDLGAALLLWERASHEIDQD